MSRIELISFAILLSTMVFYLISKRKPGSIFDYVSGFKELDREFKCAKDMNLHSSEIFKSSRYGYNLLFEYTIKLLSVGGFVFFGIIMVSLLADFFLKVAGYESGISNFMIYIFIFVSVSVYLTKKTIMKMLVKELEENADKIDDTRQKEATI